MRSGGVSAAEAELRTRVIEQVLGAVENRWIEREIRRAADQGEDPVKAARKAVGWMGSLRGDLWWDTCAKGIRVRTFPPSIEFVIPWRDVAGQALGGGRSMQLSLF